VALKGSVRPGVAVANGIYWSKLSPGGFNVNSTTSSALTDMGGGATFFDNLVEVGAARDDREQREIEFLHTMAPSKME
jgi:hypothetical protein